MAIDKITASGLGDGGVSTADLADDSVTTAKVADDAITDGKLASSLDLSGKTVTLPPGTGGLDWTQTPQTSSFTAVSEKGYFVDTSSSSITVTLPASPSQGDKVAIVDYKGNSATNNIIIDSNGSTFRGNPDTYINTFSNNNLSMLIVYSDATEGWVTIYDDSATTGTSAAPQYSADVLVVAGGGGGSSGTGSGGSGAGGYLEGTMTLFEGTTYTATVGGGGTGASRNPNSNSLGAVGTNSVFNSATALGGGVGSFNGTQGINGGSGGGGGGAGVNGTGRIGTDATQGNSGGLTGYGNDGNDSYEHGAYAGSGGGGAGQVGQYPNGGNGRQWSIDSTTYAGGGGGGREQSGDRGAGGTGGGGTGTGVNSSTDSSGGTNLGGGAGGSGGGTATGAGVNNNGGSGIIKLRVLTSDYTGTITGSPTITTSGSHTFITFTGSGSYTA